MTRIDHLIYGNGWGLKSPYFDAAYYCLSGRMYARSGWFGCQLVSFQWRRPDSQEDRYLLGRRFRVFNARRRWLRWSVSWTMKLPDDINLANIEIRKLDEDLRNLTLK